MLRGNKATENFDRGRDDRNITAERFFSAYHSANNVYNALAAQVEAEEQAAKVNIPKVELASDAHEHPLVDTYNQEQFQQEQLADDARELISGAFEGQNNDQPTA